MIRKTPYNSTYPKVAVQWLNQALCIYQSLCLVDSEVPLNRHLRVAAKRYASAKKSSLQIIAIFQYPYLETLLSLLRYTRT